MFACTFAGDACCSIHGPILAPPKTGPAIGDNTRIDSPCGLVYPVHMSGMTNSTIFQRRQWTHERTVRGLRCGVLARWSPQGTKPTSSTSVNDT